MKRAFVISTVFLFALAAGAQEHLRAMGMDHARLASYLQLTADQQSVWNSVHSDMQNSVAPLLDQARGAHQQLSALLNSDSPDPLAVGNQVIAIHSLETQIHAAHDAAMQKIEALLTPDQRIKFDAWKATSTGMEQMSLQACDRSCPIGH